MIQLQACSDSCSKKTRSGQRAAECDRRLSHLSELLDRQTAAQKTCQNLAVWVSGGHLCIFMYTCYCGVLGADDVEAAELYTLTAVAVPLPRPRLGIVATPTPVD